MTTPKPLIVYISGPMTGLPDYNRPAFRQARETLVRASEWHGARPALVLDPSAYAYGRHDMMRHDQYMRIAIKMLKQATHNVQLYGWEASAGAQDESVVAWENGIKCVTIQEMVDIILEPLDNHSAMIAKTALIRARQ